MKPRILISRSESNVAERYFAAIYASGGIADSIYAPTSADGYDGLLLAGGDDVDPSLYGEENNGSDGIDRLRDDRELELCERFVRMGKPILGICRGHQLLNVYFGGSLTQHLPTTDMHRVSGGTAIHSTVSEKGSVIHRLFGDAPSVNSIHHQAVNRAAACLRVTQTCDADGTVEGMEHESLPIISVQWHPERICLSGKREDAVDALPLFEYYMSLFK